jgi:hypothetical protein
MRLHAKRFLLLFTALLTLSIACGITQVSIEHTPTKPQTPTSLSPITPTATSPLIPSPTSTTPPTPVPTVTPQPSLTVIDFEGLGDTPDHWTIEQWDARSIFVWEQAGVGHNGSRCISVQTAHPEGNDAAWTHAVDLAPGAWYNLSGWIKGENLANTSGEVAANICIMGTWESTTPRSGTFDWTEEYLTFQASETGDARIGCRLGYWGSLATGKAYFDDIEITPLTKREWQNHYLVLEDADIASSGITEEELARWQDNLDRAYEAYADLVGDVPYSGEKIGIVSVRQYPGGWAVAGNPVQWHQPYVRDTLSAVKNGDWSFGILHELGHDFDLDYRWAWDAEFMANLKMEYVVETLDARVYTEGIWYQGEELRNFYGDQYLRNKHEGKYDGTVLHYRLAEFRDAHGWDPFKQTFRQYLAISDRDLPVTRLDQFLRFIEILSATSGEDVQSRFDPGEWDWVIGQLAE